MTTGSLFRPEAIENQRRRLWGEVIIAQPVSHAALTAALTVFTGVGLVFLVTGTYDKTETVQGYIAPTGGLAQVYATHGGTIVNVLVHEGDVVTRGQPLVELSLDTSAANGPVGEKLRAQTQARIGETDTEIVAATTRFEEESRRLMARAAAIKAELASLDQRLVSETGTLKLQEDAARRVAELEANGYRTNLELNQRQQQVMAERSAIQAVEQQREQRRGDLKDVQSQIAALPNERTDKLAQLRSSRGELEQALTQLDIHQAYVMTAPLAGRIAALQADIGQTATSQMPLVALVPDGIDLEANLLVPSRSAGLIQPGQEVRVRVDAFPYQRFGTLTGHVVQLSRSTYRPGELIAPIQYQDTVYRVTVSLERTSVAAYGADRPLAPGMTLSGDVITDRRHFIDWVLDPLRAIQSRAGYRL
jgi:membrane fusion protein